MALADITLNDGQGTPVAHTFSYTGTVANRVIRSDFSAAAEEPLTLTMAHSEATRSGVKTKSHLLRIDRTELDSDNVTPHACNIRLMCDIPNPVLSDALADDFAAYIRNWATSANVRAWVKGSVG